MLAREPEEPSARSSASAMRLKVPPLGVLAPLARACGCGCGEVDVECGYAGVWEEVCVWECEWEESEPEGFRGLFLCEEPRRAGGGEVVVFPAALVPALFAFVAEVCCCCWCWGWEGWAAVKSCEGESRAGCEALDVSAACCCCVWNVGTEDDDDDKVGVGGCTGSMRSDSCRGSLSATTSYSARPQGDCWWLIGADESAMRRAMGSGARCATRLLSLDIRMGMWARGMVCGGWLAVWLVYCCLAGGWYYLLLGPRIVVYRNEKLD